MSHNKPGPGVVTVIVDDIGVISKFSIFNIPLTFHHEML